MCITQVSGGGGGGAPIFFVFPPLFTKKILWGKWGREWRELGGGGGAPNPELYT